MTTDILGPARHVIGTRYVESVKTYILELTGLTRACGPNDVCSKEFANDRIIISTDDSGLISHLKIS
ncbi:hypothetical protein [Pseudomonas sp.]|uniref:hypothetical protein n=1 Tax=Pseudomonas sp. TaxID=306 RepID=UPI0028AF3BE2|nr:hypothetical protein [Pseudomonas sp.]